MVDYYRINVSKDGIYLFATENGEGGGGIRTSGHAAEVFELLKQKFPKSEGYKIDCTYWESRGHEFQEAAFLDF